MANRYANLTPTAKIKDEFQKINAGFDEVQADVEVLQNTTTKKTDFADVQLFIGSISAGIINLSGNINDYKYIGIVTGAAGAGTTRTELSRGWGTSGFRPDTDHINVATNGGRFLALVKSNTQIEILETNQALRFIYGLKIPW